MKRPREEDYYYEVTGNQRVLDTEEYKTDLEKYCDHLESNKNIDLGNVIQWVAIADIELDNNKEYLISDGQDVTENSWDADDNKWYGDNYSDYMWVAEMPKPPFV